MKNPFELKLKPFAHQMGDVSLPNRTRPNNNPPRIPSSEPRWLGGYPKPTDTVKYERTKWGNLVKVALLLAFMVASSVFAQTVPQITDAQRAEFFKAQSKLMAASEQAKDAQAQFQATVAKMQAACGDAFTLQMNQGGDPACVAKPKPEAKK